MADTSALLGYVEKMKGENSSWVREVKDAFGEVTVTVPRESILDACRFLKEQHEFDLLADLCGADRGPEEEDRFVVNYHLF
jgi:NADH-quinone oxidoreductase subunit C